MPTSICTDDPVVCIDFAFLFVGEFLMDWTTMAMMAILLGLLLKLRADQQRAREDAYAEQMLQFESKRKLEGRHSTWEVEDGRWTEH